MQNPPPRCALFPTAAAASMQQHGGRACACKGGCARTREAHDVRKEDRHGVERLRLDFLPSLQRLHHVLWEDVPQKILRGGSRPGGAPLGLNLVKVVLRRAGEIPR